MFFKLERKYSDEEIEKMRDAANIDRKWLEERLLPNSPMPEMYEAILRLNKLVFESVRAMEDETARRTIGEPLVARTVEMVRGYHGWGHYGWERKTVMVERAGDDGCGCKVCGGACGDSAYGCLAMICGAVAELRSMLAVAENLKVIHWAAIRGAVETAGRIERMAEGARRRRDIKTCSPEM